MPAVQLLLVVQVRELWADAEALTRQVERPYQFASSTVSAETLHRAARERYNLKVNKMHAEARFEE
jgi:hypothetical protein